MTREELRDYVDEQRALNNIPYHVYSALIDGIDTPEHEPKTGKWVKKEHLVPLPWDCSPMNPDNYDSDTHSEYEWYWHCSECDYEGDRQFRPSWKYCPNCGARMESKGK